MSAFFTGYHCDERRAIVSEIAICVVQDETLQAAESIANTTIAPGTLHASIAVDEWEQPAVRIPIDVAAGRGALAEELVYDGNNMQDGPMGAGFLLAGVESVTRCAESMAIDGEARACGWNRQRPLATTCLLTTAFHPRDATMLT